MALTWTDSEDTTAPQLRWVAQLFTGPNGVNEIANKMREAGVVVVAEGEDCVMFTIAAFDEEDVGPRLERAIKKRFPKLPVFWIRSVIRNVQAVK